MNIAVHIDTKAFDSITRKREKRIVYAVYGRRGAINNTTLRAQKAIHEHERSVLNIRKPEFFFGTPARPGGVGAKIETFANVNGPYFAEIAVGRAGSKGGPLLLSTFEEGGTRTPFTQGAKKVAVPVTGGPARPTPSSPIVKAYTFSALKFRKYKRGRVQRVRRRGKNRPETLFQEFGRLNRGLGAAQEAGAQWKGLHGTFVTPTGVRQRIGSEKRATRPVWAFVPPFPIDDRLEFVKTAQRIADLWFREEMERQTVEAVVRVRA